MTVFKRFSKGNESDIKDSLTITTSQKFVFSINSTMHYKYIVLWPVNSTWIKRHIWCHKTTMERGPTKDILHYSFEDLTKLRLPSLSATTIYGQ